MSRQNKTTTIDPLTLEQIKVAPLNVLEIQQRIIPKHQTDLHDAVNQAIHIISREYTAKAQTIGSVQLMKSNGLPIVGAVYSQSSIRPKDFIKTYMGKKVICEMTCCTIYHPTPKDTTLGQTSNLGLQEYKPQTGWIKVESRSKRNRRLRVTRECAQQNDYDYNQENISDNDDYNFHDLYKYSRD